MKTILRIITVGIITIPIALTIKQNHNNQADKEISLQITIVYYVDHHLKAK